MSEQSNSNAQQKPTGELFSRLYLERGAPLQDSSYFRNRLEAYFLKNHYKDYAEVSAHLKQEAGLVVTTSYMKQYNSVYYDFPTFFSSTPIEHILSSVTLIWRYLKSKYQEWHSREAVFKAPAADAWLAFVRRALREENMAYSVDDNCGVHFVVDEEFERNRVSALQCLDAGRYSGARAAFQAAHSYLDATPGDTKASVRSAFEALEIVARLIEPTSKNLNKWLVENKLMPLAQGLAKDDIEKATIASLFEGIGRFVDGLHNYRHGQGAEQPIAPSLPMAVYVLSSVAATLRWLVLIDSSK